MKCFMALGMLVLMTSASLADTNGSRFKIEDERSLSHRAIAACALTTPCLVV